MASDTAPIHVRVSGTYEIRAKIASWLLFFAVVFAPLPFGSTVATVIALWCIVLGVCALIVPIPPLSRGQLLLVGLAALVVASYAFVIGEQLVDPPLASPNPIWRQAGAALNATVSPIVAIARNQPWLELGRPLLCVLAIVCGFLVGLDRSAARKLVKLIAWSGAVYAAYGILAHAFDPTHILWYDKVAYLDSVTATFVNRNTAGAYFGCCAVLWSLLLWEEIKLEIKQEARGVGETLAKLVSRPSAKMVVSFVLILLCLVAMFMTGSRGATLLSLAALIVAFTLLFRRQLPHRVGVLASLASGVIVALVLLQFIGGSAGGRLDTEGLAGEGRLETYRSTLHMIADHPWLGTGQGTFGFAFPAYRSSASLWGVWTMAHNTLLEIATDMGLPIAILVTAVWIVIFAVLIRGALQRRRGALVPVAAFAVAMLAVLHSLVDFSLQIPGFSIVAMSLIGTGLAQSFSPAPGLAERDDATPALADGFRSANNVQLLGD
jgi:O-antigen ligase